MPTNIRAALSVLVALVTALAFYVESRTGSGALRWIVLGLGTVMLGAVWLFPEARNRSR